MKKQNSMQFEADCAFSAIYETVNAAAREIARDELAIKDGLISALEKSQVDVALSILHAWRKMPPGDIILVFPEVYHGDAIRD